MRFPVSFKIFLGTLDLYFVYFISIEKSEHVAKFRFGSVFYFFHHILKYGRKIILWLCVVFQMSITNFTGVIME